MVHNLHDAAMQESDDKREKKKTTKLDHQNGWLDLDGRFHPLKEANLHCEWCEQNSEGSCRRERAKKDCHLDEGGWFKLTKGQWVIARPTRMTRAQSDFVLDWLVHHRRDLKEFMEYVRDRWG
ncbi:MAG: hypothetical protein PHV34_08845 [Verrucomicrobiae bacterium]|nr:hypothetical protein [Verrucomicrobiae bacterium]